MANDGQIVWVARQELVVSDAAAAARIYTSLGVANADAVVEDEQRAGTRAWHFQEFVAPLRVPCFVSARVTRNAEGEVLLETLEGDRVCFRNARTRL